MKIGVPTETRPGEIRVALTPSNVAALTKKGQQIIIQTDAGDKAGYPNSDYEAAGAQLCSDRERIFEQADILVQVQSFGSNTVTADTDLAHLKPGQLILGMMDPLGNPQMAQVMADKQVTTVALEMVPRITRAQSMDVLSSMATIAGYKAVLIGATAVGRLFPMLMTAAGTLNAARVLIMGVGVAGLQACATAKRLGAVVSAYDVRPAAREQILSVGAKPIELDLQADDTEGEGGYAKEQGEDFLLRQRQAMANVLADQDIVITTAAIPGVKSPILVTEDMVRQMKPGAVIVDLAAERGGNCELTRLGETVIEHGVTILGPENIPATVAYHASQMYGRNMENLLSHLLNDEGVVSLDFEDPIVTDTVTAHGGEVCHARLRELLGLGERPSAVESSATTA